MFSRHTVVFLFCLSGVIATGVWLTEHHSGESVDTKSSSVTSPPSPASRPAAAAKPPVIRHDDRASPQAPPPARIIEPQNPLKWANGLLTIHAVDRSLVSILEELAASQREVAIVVRDKRIDRPVTIDIEAMPAEQGLRRLLESEDMLMLYGGEVNSEPVLHALIVYPKGEGTELVLSETEKASENSDPFAHALDAPDETERAHTVDDLVQRYGARAQDLVLAALNDGSDRVRKQALLSAVAAALPLPAETLAQLAVNDRLASVRLLATETLTSYVESPDRDKTLKTIKEVADIDPDPKVKAKANQILADLSGGSKPVDPAGPASVTGD